MLPEDLEFELAEDRELEKQRDQEPAQEDVLEDQRPAPFADDEVAFGFVEE